MAYPKSDPKSDLLAASRVPREKLNLVVRTLSLLIPSGTAADQISKQLKVSKRHAHRLMALARAEMARDAAPEREQARTEIVAAMRDLHAESRLKGNLRVALSALRALAEIYGLSAPIQIEARHGVVERDPDRVRERVRALAAKNPDLVRGLLEAAAADAPIDVEFVEEAPRRWSPLVTVPAGPRGKLTAEQLVASAAADAAEAAQE